MSVLAAIRPDDWNLPLLVHVLGAAALVGGLGAAAGFQLYGWSPRSPGDATAYARLSFRALLFVAFPAWWVMRLGAEWIYRKQGWYDLEETNEPTWLDIGWFAADIGGALLLVSLLLAGLGLRQLQTSGAGKSALVRAATALTLVGLLAYVVATWAMAGKPA